MTQLHAGGKFDHNSYKVSGGLQVWGFSSKCFIEKIRIRINRNNKKYFIEFKDGDAKAPLKQIGKSSTTGTKITFTIK